MSTDIAKPSPQALAAPTRSRPLQVTGKLKLVLDRVVQEGADPYEAGRIEGMHARSIRLALAKPHVLGYLRRARQVLREQARAQNIHHMIKMRAEGRNEMARLGAMRLIETDDEAAHRSPMPVSPGLQIVIVSDAPRTAPRPGAPTIDVTRHKPDEPPDAA
jgi:hypothetical protein